VVLADESRIRGEIGMPIWVDFGSMGYDGFRTTVGGVTVYQVVNANIVGPWYNFGPACEVLGLYPIMVTYFNNYDPTGVRGAPYAGFELYSWHGSDFAWPAGENMYHDRRGPGTLVPPRVIYQPEDALPVVKGDFDADTHVDLRDYQWMQICFGSSIVLASGCDWLDFDDDVDVDIADHTEFEKTMTGPQ